jgi:hypothetical protein
MTTIIAGNFEHKETADAAVAALRGAGASAEDICVFALNAEGQHHGLPTGGDVDADPRAEGGGSGGVKGAAVGAAVGLGLGLAAAPLAPIVAPAVVLGAAAAGAYAGSMAGAVKEMGEPKEEADKPEEGPPRPAGVLVAVRAPEDGGQSVATRVLRENGAREIERAEGTWEDGRWADFDPVRRPQLVALP